MSAEPTAAQQATVFTDARARWAAKSAGISTNVTENEIRARGLAAGLVDNKVCAIDDLWSGQSFSWDRAYLADSQLVSTEDDAGRECIRADKLE